MTRPTFFVQGCPTCGRRLEIRVELLGRKVACRHCQGRFIASDSATAFDLSDSGVLMRRAAELLEMAAKISTDSANQARPGASV